MKPAARQIVRWSALVLPLLAAGGCYRPDPADRPLRPGQVLDFEVLYSQNCSGCHGADGRLGPAPPLNDALFLAIASDAELTRVVSEGRRGTPMTAFARAAGGGLTPEQIESIVHGMRTKWGKSTTQPVGTLPAYVATGGHGDASTGATVFAQACAMCHGANGQGAARAGALHSPPFLALISDQALRRIIITGRPDLGMPDYRHLVDGSARPAPLSDREIGDLVALLASWRGAAQPAEKVARATGASP